MRNRAHWAQLGGAALLLAAPSPIQQVVGGALLGAGIMDEVTTSDYRGKSRGRNDSSANMTKWVGVIVIGAVLVLAFAAGGLRSLVQH